MATYHDVIAKTPTFTYVHYKYIVGANPRGETVLLLHGSFSHSQRNWGDYINVFYKRASRIYILDLPANGLSGPDIMISGSTLDSGKDEYVLSRLVQYVNEFRQYIIGGVYMKMTLVGYSFGAYLLIFCAQQLTCTRLILISPCAIFPFMGRYATKFAKVVRGAINYNIIGLVTSLMGGGANSKLVSSTDQLSVYSNMTEGAYINYMFKATDGECWFTIPAIMPLVEICQKIPVIFIHGAKDILVEPFYLDYLKCLGIGRQHIILGDVGHNIYASTEYESAINMAMAATGYNNIQMSRQLYLRRINWAANVWHNPADLGEYKKRVGDIWPRLLCNKASY